MRRIKMLLTLAVLIVPAWVQAAVWDTYLNNLFVPRGFTAAADSARLQIPDTTLAAFSGKRIVRGRLTDAAWNCTNPTFAGDTYDCAGSYDKFRLWEITNSIHRGRSTQAIADSGGWWPMRWQGQITTAGDSFIVYDIDARRVFAVLLKQANGSCGNFAFNDFDTKDGVIRIATNGAGVCEWDYLADQILRYSTAGVRKCGNSQTRNSTANADTALINSSPALTANVVMSVAIVRDAFGKPDALGRLSHWWGGETSTKSISMFNPANAGIWDEASTSNEGINLKATAGGALFYTESDATRDHLYLKQSIFPIAADSWNNDTSWDNNTSGAEDLAWTNAAVFAPRGLAVVDRASIAGSNSPVAVIGSDEGAYFIMSKAGTNVNGSADAAMNGVKIRLTNSYIAAPEFGDCVLSAVNGDNTTDASPYGNTLTAVGSPGFTAGSSTIVFSGAYSSTSDSYLKRQGSDAEFALGDGVPFMVDLWFKSQSATNPSTYETLFYMTGSAGARQIEILCQVDGTIHARATDDSRATYDSVATTADFYDAKWHKVSYISGAGGTSWYLYVDGIKAATGTMTNVNTALGTDEVWIGANYLGAKFYNGHIAQVSVNKPIQMWGQSQGGLLAFTGNVQPWGYRRGMASLLVEPNGRKLHALDVDYMQSYGTAVVMGDEDSCVVWDAALGLPLPGRRFGSPGGNIQDVALDGGGPDSLSLSIVTTAKTKNIEPDPRIADLAGNQSPFVQPAVGERVVVDSTGAFVFWAVDDAVDAAANADRSQIFICDGTYGSFDVDQANQTIVGESWDAVILGGADDAIDVTANYVTITNLTAKTPAGGGVAVNAISTTSDWTIFDKINIPTSDLSGFFFSSAASQGKVLGCTIGYPAGAIDNQGIAIDNADIILIEGNDIADISGEGIGSGNSGTNYISIIGNQINATPTSILTYAADNYINVIGNITDGTITNNATSGGTANNLTF